MATESAKVKFTITDLALYMEALLQNRACFLINTERGPISPILIGGGNIEKFKEYFGRELPNKKGPFLAKRALERGINAYFARAAHYTDPSDASTLTFTKSESTLTDRGTEYATVTLGTTQKVKYTAKMPGTEGNGISVEQDDPSGASQSLSISVTDKAIKVSLATDGDSALISTCAEVAQAINAHVIAKALVQAEVIAAGVAEEVVATNLAGGGATAAYATATLGDTQKVKYTAKLKGTEGNTVKVTHTDPLDNDQPIVITVADKEIDVSLATNGVGALISTCAEVATAIANHITANVLVAAEALTEGVAEDVLQTTLAGGVNGTNTLKIKAKSEGDWSTFGKLRYKIVPSETSGLFSLYLDFTLQPEMNAIYCDLSMDPVNERYAPAYVNARSQLVELEDLAEGVEPFAYRSPANSPSDGQGGYCLESFVTPGVGNAADVVSADLQGDSGGKTGIYVFDSVDDAWLIAVPEDTSNEVWVKGAGYTANRDGDMVFGHCIPNISPQKAVDWRKRQGEYSGTAVSTPWATLFYAHLKTPHPTKNDMVIPGTADAIAAILYAQSQSKHKAPAGLKRAFIPNVLAVVDNVGSGGRVTEADLLAAAQINPIASYAGEPACLWDEQTAYNQASPLQYLHTVHLLILIKKACKKSIRIDLFEPHLPKTWRLLHRKFTDFLSQFPDDALTSYRVQCDENASTVDDAILNTPARREAGEFVCRFFLKATPAIRTIGIQAVMTKLSVSFEYLMNIPDL